MNEHFSLLRASDQRPLPVALAHRIVTLKPGDPRNEVTARLYRRLSEADQLRCHAEMLDYDVKVALR